jgi:heme-degrading monooxygenase HmoA
MITEIAHLRITPGREEEFKQAFASVEHLLTAARGHISHALQQGIEDPSHFVSIVQWETVADHLEGFRPSEACKQFRAAFDPFRAAPAQVEHFERVVSDAPRPAAAPNPGL